MRPSVTSLTALLTTLWACSVSAASAGSITSMSQLFSEVCLALQADPEQIGRHMNASAAWESVSLPKAPDSVQVAAMWRTDWSFSNIDIRVYRDSFDGLALALSVAVEYIIESDKYIEACIIHGIVSPDVTLDDFDLPVTWSGDNVAITLSSERPR